MSTVVARAPSARAPQRPERRGTERRAGLEVVSRRASRRRRPKLVPILAACVLSGSLFAVVIGHAVLAQDQLRLAAVQSAITTAQAVHRRDVISVANLENPSRIVREAEQSLHMVTPTTVDQLPHVTLHKPVPAPSVASTTPGGTSVAAGNGG